MRPPAWTFYGFATFWAVLVVVWLALDYWLVALTNVVVVVILCSFPVIRADVYRKGFKAGYHRGVMGWPPESDKSE